MSTARLEAVATDAKQDIPMQPASLDIWDKKYRLKTKQGVALDADIAGGTGLQRKGRGAVRHEQRRHAGGGAGCCIHQGGVEVHGRTLTVIRVLK